MNICIDESGSFVSAQHTNSWNAVAAIAFCEDSVGHLEGAIQTLKTNSGAELATEVKLHQVSEDNYFIFLETIGECDVVVAAVATDAGINSIDIISEHKTAQAQKFLENVSRMIYDEGKENIRNTAAQIEQLSPQLYFQFICQIRLMNEIVKGAITHFVQSNPCCLSSFSWSIDQKNSTKTEFEQVFEQLSPALLQTESIRKPMIMIEGEDYSALSDYYYSPGEAPTYLKETYGIEGGIEGPNIQKIIRDDISFIDSQTSAGIQTIDLIVSGLRRCLRLGFSDNARAAMLLGRLMTQSQTNEFPIELITLGKATTCPVSVANLIRIMAQNCQSIIVDTNLLNKAFKLTHMQGIG